MLQTMTPFAMNSFLSAIKGYLLTAPGMQIKLFQNNMNPSPQNVVSDFTEADYDGYTAKVSTTLFGPTRQPDGSFRLYNFQNFVMTGSVVQNTIYGFYVLDSLNNLIVAQRFNAPVNMQDSFSACTFELQFNLPQNGITGDPQPQ